MIVHLFYSVSETIQKQLKRKQLIDNVLIEDPLWTIV